MTDDYSDEEFAPIAAGIKRLPQFDPSAQFADRIMARVNAPVAANVPVLVRQRQPVARDQRILQYEQSLPARGAIASIPARIAAVALIGSVGLAMSFVTLFALFQMDLLVIIARIFGDGAISYIAALSADAATTAASTGAVFGTAAGMAITGSFVAGAIAATAVLKAAASANRKAA